MLVTGLTGELREFPEQTQAPEHWPFVGSLGHIYRTTFRSGLYPRFIVHEITSEPV